MKTLKVISLLLLIAIAPAFAQLNSLTQTSLSSAILSTDKFFSVASATGINAPNIAAGTVGSLLFVQDPGSKGEAMRVQSISGTTVTVARGVSGTQAVAHISGAMVLIGAPNWFYSVDPVGACTASTTYVTPWLNLSTGNQWLCSTVTGNWVPGFNNSAVDPSVTGAVASAAGLITPSGQLFHITGALAITGFTIPLGYAFGPICVIPDGTFTTTTANNIALASTAVVSKQLCFAYDASTAKFYPSY